ncbi:MAG: zf-HC2 domain-containing protein, partial [bacterium]|nr:zf-HC2 domain-containing protein [bacterium]
MTCSEIRDLLGNYMDEELSDRMMQRVEKHLLRCPACAYEARSLEQARQLLRRGVERPMVSDALGERVLQQVAERFVHLRPHSSEEALTLPLS